MTEKTKIWESLSKTDPRHTKNFKRAGGFSGTALKPIWIVKRLTEEFGPCGEGWGMGEPSFQTIPGDNGEMLVYCTVSCWHGRPGNVFYGVGGDKVTTYIKANEQYKRPERWENDDEAFKKAFTDAVGNAFKFVGVGADIHMGQFENSKYIKEVTEDFEDAEKANGPAPRTRLDGPHTSKTALMTAIKALTAQIGKAETPDAIDALLKGSATVKQAQRDWPELLDGDPNNVDIAGLKAYVAQRRDAVAGNGTPNISDGDMLALLLDTMKQCHTLKSFTGWMATNEPFIDGLSDIDRRALEKEVDAFEAGLQAQGAHDAG